MAGKSFLRVQRGQRIDTPDFDHAVHVSLRDALAQVVDRLIIGDDQTGVASPLQRFFVLRGFIPSIDAAGLLTVIGGTGILGLRAGGGVVRGALVSEGQALQTRDLSTYANGTYNVYIRATARETGHANRPFWNPLAAPDPTEFLRNVATRLTEDWDLTVQLTSPGAEWVVIGIVTISGGPSYVYACVDSRPMLFEGRSTATLPFLLEDADWGTAADRAVTRETSGITGLERFVKMTLRQIQDIVGGLSTFINPHSGVALTGIGPRSLTSLNDEKLARSGGTASAMVGPLVPANDISLSVGTITRRWASVWTNNLTVSAVVEALTVTISGVLTANSASVTGTLGVGGATTLTGAAALSSTLAVTGAAALSDTLTVGGATTLSNTLAVTSAAALSSTLTVGGLTSLTNNCVVTGVITGSNTVQGQRLTATESMAGTPVPDTIYSNSMIKALARIAVDGVGGITLPVGFNCNVSLSSAVEVQITFPLGFASSNYFEIAQVHSITNQYVIIETSRSATVYRFEIRTAAGVAQNLSVGGLSFEANFAFFGEQ